MFLRRTPRRIAFIRMPLGADRGTLYVMDSMTGSLETAIALADDVAAKLCWYDPAP